MWKNHWQVSYGCSDLEFGRSFHIIEWSKSATSRKIANTYGASGKIQVWVKNIRTWKNLHLQTCAWQIPSFWGLCWWYQWWYLLKWGFDILWWNVSTFGDLCLSSSPLKSRCSDKSGYSKEILIKIHVKEKGREPEKAETAIRPQCGSHPSERRRKENGRVVRMQCSSSNLSCKAKGKFWSQSYQFKEFCILQG